MANQSRVLPAVQGNKLTRALRLTGWKKVKAPLAESNWNEDLR